MASPPIELEAASSVDSLLEGYDAASDSWKFPRSDNFWQAVQHAHDLGRRGQGSRVAIIDSGFDLDHPRLKRRVGNVYTSVKRPAIGHHAGHGTVVAMLISEVAPDCILDIYNIVEKDGKLEEEDVAEAVSRASHSNAAVINLSLGTPRHWFPPGEPIASPSRSELVDELNRNCEKDPCPLCRTAVGAVQVGKIVFAAVGNQLDQAYCPARAKGVVAVGFQNLRKRMPGPGMEVSELVPVFGQAIDADLMLLQVEGALGSSFASPLYAGVAALGLTKDELSKYVSSYSERVSPLRAHALVDTGLGGVSKADPALLDEIDRGYWRTISKLPHAHCQVQLPYASGASLMDPADCPFCGIFADLQYINLGYWLYSRGRPKEALDVLKAAQSLCPWSAEVVASEGSAYAAMGQFYRAVAAYEKAVLMRRDYPPYKAALESLRTSASLMSHAIDGDGLSSLLDPGATPLDIVRERRREHRRMNRIYGVLAAGVVVFHLVDRTSVVARWLFLVPIVVGLLRARQCSKNVGWCNRYFHLTPNHTTRNELKDFAGQLRMSAVVSAISVVGLLAVLFLV